MLLSSLIISVLAIFAAVDFNNFALQQKAGIVSLYLILLLLTGLFIRGATILRQELNWVLHLGGIILGAIMILVVLLSCLQTDKSIFVKLLFLVGLPGISLLRAGYAVRSLSTNHNQMEENKG